MADCREVAVRLGELVSADPLLLPEACCWDCHDDAEGGYFPLADVEVDGRWFAVCCRWMVEGELE